MTEHGQDKGKDEERRKIDRRKDAKFSNEIEGYIDEAAKRGAKEAIDQLYAEIGRAGIRKLAIAIGAAVAVLVSWVVGSGHLPK